MNRLSLFLALLSGLLACSFDPQNHKANAALADDAQFAQVFDSYRTHFNKYYFHSNELPNRRKIFKKNLKMIHKRNKETGNNFALSLNKFSDLSWEEFQKSFLLRNNVKEELKEFQKNSGDKIVKFRDYRGKDYKKFPKHHSYTACAREGHDTVELLDDSPSDSDVKRSKRHGKSHGRLLPSSKDKAKAKKLKSTVNWKNYASVVQDQMSCASCYAFSSLAAYETLYSMTNGQQLNLSEQEIIDCSKQNDGCIGGSPFLVYDYINNSGISTEKQYPYTGVVGKKCRAAKKSKKINDQFNYYFLDSSIFDLLQAMAYGPVVVIHHVNDNFKQYMNGVFDDPTCDGELNHSSLAIAYDLTAPIPYILCKNAWATDWGEEGYYKLAIGTLSSSSRGTCNVVDHDMNVAPYFDN